MDDPPSSYGAYPKTVDFLHGEHVAYETSSASSYTTFVFRCLFDALYSPTIDITFVTGLQELNRRCPFGEARNWHVDWLWIIRWIIPCFVAC